jgi:signal recognition particle subunit SRP54
VATGTGTGPDFTLEDFRQQLERLQRVGLLGDVLAGLPGIAERTSEGEDPSQNLRRIQGMIDAMTRKERASPDLVDNARRRRIAAGAGVVPQEVERFLRQFQHVRVLMKQMAEMSVWPDGGA